MARRYEETATKFAKSQGFDGVMPYEPRFSRPDNVPDGFEWYEAGLFTDCGADGEPNWHPLFDSTLHCIIANNEGARWRSDDDVIMLS